MSVRVRALDECDGKLMNYITISLFKFRVIIGISNAGGVCRTMLPRSPVGHAKPFRRGYLQGIAGAAEFFLTAYRASDLRKLINDKEDAHCVTIARDWEQTGIYTSRELWQGEFSGAETISYQFNFSANWRVGMAFVWIRTRQAQSFYQGSERKLQR